MYAKLQLYLNERRAARLAFFGFCIELVCMFLTIWFPLPALSQHVGPLDLKGITQYSPLACVVYVLILVALFTLWWQGWRFAHNEEARTRGPLVLVFAVMFACTLALMYPVNATDLLQYAFRSRVFAIHRSNPFVLTPQEFPGDPILPYVGEWTYIPSPYGPVWELLAGGVAWLTRGQLLPTLLGLKAVVVVFYLGTALVLDRLLATADPSHRTAGVLFFAWNPLVLLELAGNGHNDAVMLFFIVLGFYLLVRERALLSILALVAAALCKVIALLVIPPVLIALLLQRPSWRARIGFLAKAGVLTAGLTLALYAPFWPPWESIAGLLGETTGRYGFSIPTLLLLALQALISPHLGSLSTSAGRMTLFVIYDLPRWIAQGLFAVLYLRLLVRVWRGRTRAVVTSYQSLFTYLITAPSFRVWYPTWLVPLAALEPDEGRAERSAVFCATAALSVVIYGYVWGWLRAHIEHLGIHAIAVPLVFIPPLIVPWLLRKRAAGQQGLGRR
ncbi:MAG: hypothetical protein SVX38_06885 [Chloroflexota bacterium]|nr:hypothetical protein [Chloroflexota bacterium]